MTKGEKCVIIEKISVIWVVIFTFDVSILSSNIKRYRIAKGLSQSELAEKVFVRAQSVSKWERGTSIPDLDKLCLIAEIFEVSLDALTGYSSERESFMIGVHGDSSKTEFLLFGERGHISNRLLLGGSNPNTYGLKDSYTTIKAGIDKLMAIKPNIKGIYIGCAGFDTGNNAASIRELLKKSYPSVKIKCSVDIVSAIASVTDEQKCICAISGTGSVVVAYTAGEYTRFAGWGTIFDKAGSGYDIGREALYAALQEHDKLGEESIITKMVESKLHDNVFNKLDIFYRSDVSYIASFAPIVFEAYEKGDAVAIGIIEENTDRLAYIINRAYKLNPHHKTVALAGSLYKNEAFLECVKKKLDPDLTVVTSQRPQVYGACMLCCQMCKFDTRMLSESFEQNYKDFTDHE
ncbi:MAG: XRE family transcriptional regulator [Ruminococcaceae bacterium]|nr:XRE family transcriptional regulator [Oscillospiraceae bacterium]